MKFKRLNTLLSIAALIGGIPTVANAAAIKKGDDDAVDKVVTVTGGELELVEQVTGGIGVYVSVTGENRIHIAGGEANVETLSVSGKNSFHGLFAAASGTGDITIGSPVTYLTGKITTASGAVLGEDGGAADGAWSSGIYAKNSGLGGISIYTAATIETSGYHSRGIQAEISNTANEKDLIIVSSGDMTFNGSGYASIQAAHHGKGDIYIASSGDVIADTIGNSNGIFAEKGPAASGHIYVGYNSDGSAAPITGTYRTAYEGWLIYGWHRGTGDINLNVGNASLTSGAQKATGDSTIFASYAGSTTGNIDIKVADATIETNGVGNATTNMAAIEAKHQGTGGNITIASAADINTNRAHGIYVSTTSDSYAGDIAIGTAANPLNGKINTSGAYAHGIYVQKNQGAGRVDIHNAASITVSDATSYGLYVGNGVKLGSVINEGFVANSAANGTAILIAGGVTLELGGGANGLITGDVAFTAEHANALTLGTNAQRIDGNLVLSSSTLFAVSATSVDDYQTLTVDGTAFLNNATLQFDDRAIDVTTLINGTTTFDILVSGGIGDAFAGLSEGSVYTSLAGNQYLISYQNGNASLSLLAAVPEPASWAAMAGLAGLVVMVIRSRKRMMQGR